MGTWEQEALRLCGRYVDEVVIAFELCPWAEPSWRGQRVARAVCLSPAPTPAECLPFVESFAAADAPALDIGLLIFPRHGGGWAAFDGFAEQVRRALAARNDGRAAQPGHGVPVVEFLVAAFHPDGAETFAGPHQLVSFLRRTPDPVLQFVRAEVIDRLKNSQPDASDDLSRRNYQALRGGRALELDAAVRAIRADRDASYARLVSGPDSP